MQASPCAFRFPCPLTPSCRRSWLRSRPGPMPSWFLRRALERPRACLPQSPRRSCRGGRGIRADQSSSSSPARGRRTPRETPVRPEHLDSATKLPPPTLRRWSDDSAPEPGILFIHAPADSRVGGAVILLQNPAYYSSMPPPTLCRWSDDSAPEPGILFVPAPADFMSVER